MSHCEDMLCKPQTITLQFTIELTTGNRRLQELNLHLSDFRTTETEQKDGRKKHYISTTRPEGTHGFQTQVSTLRDHPSFVLVNTGDTLD